MRKKLPILLLALIILLQAFSPAVFAASKKEATVSTVSFCSSDTTPEGAGKGTFGPNTVGAAERYVPKNIKMVDEKLLRKNGLDAHQIKDDVVGGNLSKYDIYVDKDTGQLWVYGKGGKGEGIPTGEYIKK